MASALVNIKCSIEKLEFDKKRVGIIIDLTESIAKSIAAIDALSAQKINGFAFIDSDQKLCLVISLCNEIAYTLETETRIMLTKEKLEILRNLMLDVFSKIGFDGYHYDLEISDEDSCLDVSFLLQRGNSNYRDI